jgi:hypothetical protein
MAKGSSDDREGTAGIGKEVSAGSCTIGCHSYCFSPGGEPDLDIDNSNKQSEQTPPYSPPNLFRVVELVSSRKRHCRILWNEQVLHFFSFFFSFFFLCVRVCACVLLLLWLLFFFFESCLFLVDFFLFVCCYVPNIVAAQEYLSRRKN